MSGLIPGRLLPSSSRPGLGSFKSQPDYVTQEALAELEEIHTVEELRRSVGYRTREENYRGKRDR